MSTAINTLSNRNHERFEENRRFEEMTDIAERLGFPIDTTIQYEMKNGAAYCRTDTVDRPFHNQTLQALLRGESVFQGDQAFEVERLRLEHQEALLVDSFGRGELSGNILVKVSKIPDAVVDGQTTIKGYRRDLLRSFVRIYHLAQDGVECRLFTLDRNSPTGMKAVGELLDIDTSAPSEEVLASHSLFQVSGNAGDFVDELVDRTKLVYDECRLDESGERSYAGSKYIDKQNAMQEIHGQMRLVDQHMNALAEIVRIGLGEDAIELQRRHTAAAIKLSSRGQFVESSGDSSVATEAQNGNYDRECATATTANGMNQAQSQNMENIWTRGECQVCFAKTMVGSCMVCAGCARADDRGVDLLKLRKENLRSIKRRRALAATSLEKATTLRTPQRQKQPRKTEQHIRTRRRVVIGTAVTETYDSRTGEVLLVS